ncbi:methyl-accepting chemotaxis protein [Heliorestis acidaminivorans]|nr:methyl-accepting chemotaxis protein [Heliorestis acidaminivorans]
MNWLRNLKIAKKLLLLIVLTALSLSAVGYIGYYYMSNMNENAQEMYFDRLVPVKELNEALTSLKSIELLSQQLFDARDANQIQSIVQVMRQENAEIEGIISDFEQTYLLAYERERVPILKDALSRYQTEQERIIALASQGQQYEAHRYYDEVAIPQIEQANKVLLELATFNANVAEELQVTSAEAFQSALIIMIGITLLAIVISSILGLYISRIIVQPIQQLDKLMERSKEGDLTGKGEIMSVDETGNLTQSFNQMMDQLQKFVRQVQDGAQSVAATSQQISASTEEMAAGAQSQAEQVQSLSTLLSEMAKAANQMAQSSEKAAFASEKATKTTHEGGKTIVQTIDGMDEIATHVTKLGENSGKIGEIVEMIDDIASQTNLLALNAAIEAARAGDAGKGFAVVAEEVRKLAERSGGATKEIATLIKTIQSITEKAVQSANEGRLLAQQAGQAFDEIQGQVNETGSEVSEIAAAAEEQAALSEQSANAVQSVAAITEETSAAAQETASATQASANQAMELQESAKQFKI